MESFNYITGMHALNFHEPGDTTSGDWHGAIWDAAEPLVRNTSDSAFGNEGIRELVGGERCQGMRVAGHARAILDMLELGMTSQLLGFFDDWLDGNEAEVDAVMRGALKLKCSPHWDAIDGLMSRELGSLGIMRKVLR